MAGEQKLNLAPFQKVVGVKGGVKGRTGRRSRRRTKLCPNNLLITGFHLAVH